MSLELQRCIQHFGAENRGGTWMAKCPSCGHSSLSLDAGKKQAVLAHCFNCNGANKSELGKLVREIAGRDTPVTVPMPKPREKRVWTEAQLTAKLAMAERTLATDKVAQKFLMERGIRSNSHERCVSALVTSIMSTASSSLISTASSASHCCSCVSASLKFCGMLMAPRTRTESGDAIKERWADGRCTTDRCCARGMRTTRNRWSSRRQSLIA